MSLRAATLIFGLLALGHRSPAQTAYFIDGYHGGIYGHLPSWQTSFMVEKLAQYPDWKINLELEPESWDTIAVHDPVSYKAFRQLFADQSAGGRIEYINPAYGQSYMYNISGESVIRQLYYGMRKLRQHFPTAVFSTYSSEEPCFTSALPQILRSYGFKYASLKNPNTCWGGYTRAFGGELVNWIGPDGTGILTSPRYAIESLKPNSIWETIAASNSKEYVQKALAYGIAHPVGMCLQDAGWAFGPWLRGAPAIYETWRGYMSAIIPTSTPTDWRFTQEDVLVSLMWGSQILQRIARQVRSAENRIIVAEKLAALAKVWRDTPWPGESLDEGWRTLLLSQHHDCWIVPYNGKPGDTWADKVVAWTGNTTRRSDSIAAGALDALADARPRSSPDPSARSITVVNTTASPRDEYVRIALPAGWRQAVVLDEQGARLPTQPVAPADSTAVDKDILFKAQCPSMGYSIYQLLRRDPSPGPATPAKGAHATQLANGSWALETNLYHILLDPRHGGVIRSWIDKKTRKEFIPKGQSFNELRGNFYNDGGFRTSTETPAEIRILENGPLEVRAEIRGSIAGHPFVQIITAQQNRRRVDARLTIQWRSNTAIGEYFDNPKNDQVRKAYYDERYKLLALFPLQLEGQKVYKDAPYDVLASRLDNTFFNRWDSIKNNILLHWVDVTDKTGSYGMALFCDHTTSYAHGRDVPLGLTVQYSGNGIFYRDYTIDRPTVIDYAWIPHRGNWEKAGLWTEGAEWNEPLLTRVSEFAFCELPKLPKPPQPPNLPHSLLSITGAGYDITALTCTGDRLRVRLFNAEGDNSIHKIYLGFRTDSVIEIALNGDKIRAIPIHTDPKGKRYLDWSQPRFGIRTLEFIKAK
jgi:alpha-mannosidase